VVLAMWIVRLGYSRHTATIGASILAFASPFWHFGVKGFYSEPYTTLALLVAAYLLSSPMIPHAAAFSGLALGAACGCRINTVILFPAFILCLAFQTRFRGLTRIHLLRESGLFAAAFSVCAFLIGLANYAPFGSPLKTGYHLAYPSASLLFATPLFHGMYELLINGEIGLLVFTPWILVALICFPSFARKHLPESVLCGTLFLFTFVFFAKYDAWHAGWVAGPRFLTPTLPFLAMLTVPWIEKLQRRGTGERWPRSLAILRAVTIVLLLTGAGIQIVGVPFPEDRYYSLILYYYVDRSVKPWWAGSIPLASIAFLSNISAANAHSVRPTESTDGDQLAIVREQAHAYATMNAAKTERDFLDSFPNSENLVSPNLMLYKMKLLGLPSSAVYCYGGSIAFLGLLGLMGLRRSTRSDQK